MISEKAWKHIRERHPEISTYRGRIEDVVLRPELVVKSRGAEFKAIGLLPNTRLGPKYLVVVYVERKGQKSIITAYFTSDLKRVRGEVVWRA